MMGVRKRFAAKDESAAETNPMVSKIQPAGGTGFCNTDEFPRCRNVATCAAKA
jgi:hypothetical protein